VGKVTGFLEIDRQVAKYQPASDRIRHFKEFVIPMSDSEISKQAARCMDCGIPYCHGPTGCPVHNQIPDWNDLVYSDNWDEAIRNLHSTNNFPEFTGRICPAPCEEACTLNLEDAPVAIKTIEQAIADKAYERGFIVPQPASRKTGKKVAVIGSGPAGLAAAQQLGRAGHEVHVYEREDKPGGLLRYGIPDFKMEKHFIDRRVEQMSGEGVTFFCGVNVGVDQKVEDLRGVPHLRQGCGAPLVGQDLGQARQHRQVLFTAGGGDRHDRPYDGAVPVDAVGKLQEGQAGPPHPRAACVGTVGDGHAVADIRG